MYSKSEPEILLEKKHIQWLFSDAMENQMDDKVEIKKENSRSTWCIVVSGRLRTEVRRDQSLKVDYTKDNLANEKRLFCNQREEIALITVASAKGPFELSIESSTPKCFAPVSRLTKRTKGRELHPE